jgi:hypothetical protein
MRYPTPVQEKVTCVHTAEMELNLHGLSDDPAHVIYDHFFHTTCSVPSDLKMEAARISKTSINYQSIGHHTHRNLPTIFSSPTL